MEVGSTRREGLEAMQQMTDTALVMVELIVTQQKNDTIPIEDELRVTVDGTRSLPLLGKATL